MVERKKPGDREWALEVASWLAVVLAITGGFWLGAVFLTWVIRGHHSLWVFWLAGFVAMWGFGIYGTRGRK